MKKENNKIKIIMTLIIAFLYTLTNKVYSYSFNDIVDIIGIPRFNNNLEEINQEIYEKYNVFVYSNPVDIQKRTNLQRFKEVKDKGKYLYNGKQGEFYILGTNLTGKYVYNVYFPVDVIPESLPETWNYIYYKIFEDSWNSGYKFEEQIDYMKNTNLMFDKIDLVNKTCDSYDLVDYDIVPSKVGLGKFRLNTAATWKTMGIVTAKRRLRNGSIREVVFSTKPMALDADVSSKLEVKDEVYINEDEDEKEISIEFGAKAINLSKYAKPEHIKKINSEIYINGKYIDSISGNKTAEVDKKINFVVSRSKNNIDAENIVLKVEVKSYLYTEFLVDGLMYDFQTKEILVKIAPKKLVPIKYIKLNLLSKQNETLVISPLVQTIETKSAQSLGFIEHGRRLAIWLDLGIEIENIKNIIVYINTVKCNYNIIKKERTYLIFEPDLNELVHISISGINTLRNICDSYLEVEKNDIGKRVKEANKIDILVKLNITNREYKYTCSFDVFDNYLNNINYSYYNNIINYEEINNKYEI